MPLLIILISQGKLNLDEDVTQHMISWKISAKDYSGSPTLRQILSMTSGFSYEPSSSNVPIYKQGESLPTLNEILNGKYPAKNSPIKLFFQPGSRYQYSGAGYQVMQQLIEDITKMPFNQLLMMQVLKPLKMNHSVFQFPLAHPWKVDAVPGFTADGEMLHEGWDNIPSTASGGMWSTPSDFAKFIIYLSKAYRGVDNSFLSRELAIEMLTQQKNSSFGLGVVIDGDGESLNFRKNGHNTGYHDEFLMFPNTGQGIVIMTNSANGIAVINDIMPIIAHQYHWPTYSPYFNEIVEISSSSNRDVHSMKLRKF